MTALDLAEQHNGGAMNTDTRQPDLSPLRALLAYNATLPQLALDAAIAGDVDLARAYIRVAMKRNVPGADTIGLQIEKIAKGG